MIIVKLMGGLGNQMFQYAMGRSVAFHIKTMMKQDISYYSNDPLRKYSLNCYNISENFASQEEIKKLDINQSFKNPFYLLEKLKPRYQRCFYYEDSFRYDPDVQKIGDNTYLSGYWQSEKYFLPIKNIIKSEFSLNITPDVRNQEMAQEMDESESISLHVRRGDYVNNPVTNEYHGLCTLDYYKQAIKTLTVGIEKPHFYIFSDDMEWVRKNLVIPGEVEFVTHNGPEHDFLDLWLMSHCKHNIIANSSFSWWGAWLNNNPEKIVIAPKKWFNDPKIDTSDLIPDSWIKI